MTSKDNRPIDPEQLKDEYDDSVDFATGAQGDTVIIDSDKLAKLETVRIDNLPSSDRDGSWVAGHHYETLYDTHIDSEQEKAVLLRNYEKAYEQNTLLRSENDRLMQEASEYRSDYRAADSYNKDREAELMARENQVEAAERRFRPLKIGLIAGTIASLLAAIFFFFMWMNLENEESSIGQRDAAQQEQVRGLRTSLEQEREDHEATRSELGNVNSQVESLNDQLDELRKENTTLQDTVDNRDKDIERINGELDQLRDQNDELNSREPETVTRTFVQQQPGEVQTETNTVTETETTTVTSNER